MEARELAVQTRQFWFPNLLIFIFQILWIPISACDVSKGKFALLTEGANISVQIIPRGPRHCIRSSADLDACVLHTPAGLVHDRFMNSWEPKVQAWPFH